MSLVTRHHLAGGRTVRSLLSILPLVLVFCGRRWRRGLSDISVCTWGLYLSTGWMFEAFIDRCVVSDNLYFIGERPRHVFSGYHLGSLAIQRRLVSNVLIIIVWSRGGMAVHYIVGRFFVEPERQNGIFDWYGCWLRENHCDLVAAVVPV